MRLDPKHLAQLSVVVEAGSFQTAADKLGLTQPALSRNMKLLEARLEAPLFRREGRRSVPTALGLRLAKTGMTIRLAEEQAGVVVGQTQSGALGELRIGAPPIVAGRFLTSALAAFIQAHPECSVELRTGLVSELRGLLERGQIDVIVGPQSLAQQGSGVVFDALMDDRVGIMCRQGHPLTRVARLGPDDLDAQMWLAHSRGSLLRLQTEAALLASGVQRLKIACETDSIRSVLEIVAMTDLITTMPRATTAPYLEDALAFLPFDHPQFHRPIGLVQRQDSHDAPVQRQFLATLKAQVAARLVPA